MKSSAWCKRDAALIGELVGRASAGRLELEQGAAQCADDVVLVLQRRRRRAGGARDRRWRGARSRVPSARDASVARSFCAALRPNVGTREVAEQARDVLGNVRAACCGDEIEELLGGFGLGLDDARQAENERRRNARIAFADRSVEHLPASAQRLLRVGRDRRDERDRGAPPLGRREALVESRFELALERRGHRGEQPARDGRVAPDERLAIAEQRLVNVANVALQELEHRVLIALLSAHHRFARGVLDELRGETPFVERAGARLDEPAAAQIADAHDGERERIGIDVRADRHVEHETDARPHRRRFERSAGPSAMRAATSANVAAVPS